MTSANYQQNWRDRMRMEAEFLENSDDEISSVTGKSESGTGGDQDMQSISGNESDHFIAEEEGLVISSEDGGSSSEEEIDFDFRDGPVFAEQLRDWAVKNKSTRTELSELLKILHLNGHDDLPKDPRTLLKTPREVAVEQKCGGNYIYFGVKRGILRCLQNFPDYNSDTIKLIVNADGIPLFKSTGLDLWPILGMFVYPRPFVISLFTGQGKPDNPEEFLEDFLNEYRDLKNNGLLSDDNRHFNVLLWCMTCDAPARQFLKCIKGHGGYFACERCTIKGEREGNRTVFLSTEEPARTDESFDNFEYEGEHQHFPSPLIGSGIKCVKDFPLDYMHLVCLGVMKRLLQFLKEGPRICRLSRGQLTRVSQQLQNYRGKMPSEFARQPRGLDQLSRFKATEFRSFLLYYGCVVLQDVLPGPAYKHFLSLVTALRILLDEDDDYRNHNLNFAKELLELFSDNASIYYTEAFTVYLSPKRSALSTSDSCENKQKQKSNRRSPPPPNSAYNVPELDSADCDKNRTSDSEDEYNHRLTPQNQTTPKQRTPDDRFSSKAHFEINYQDSGSAVNSINKFASFADSPRRSPRPSPCAKKSLGFHKNSCGKDKQQSKIDRPSSTKNKECYPLSEADFQRKIVNLLLDIKKCVKQSDTRNSESLYQRSAPSCFDTLEKLLEYDRSLANQVEFEKLIDLFLTIGGNDARSLLSRMLAMVTTNEVLSSINWDGTGEKTSLKESFPNLLEALQKCTRSKLNVDDAVIKEKLQKILKDAPDREGGTRWAKKKEKKNDK